METKDVRKEKKKVTTQPQVQHTQKEFAIAEVKKPTWRIEDKMTVEELDKKVTELIASRGRKGVDHREMLRQLEVLTKAARLHGAFKEIPVLMHLISAMFDTQKGIDDYMDHQQWNTCYRALSRVLSLIEENIHLRVLTLGTDDMADIVLSFSKSEITDDDRKTDSIVRVVGSVDSFVLRLEEEYNKSLQQINPHTQVSYKTCYLYNISPSDL